MTEPYLDVSRRLTRGIACWPGSRTFSTYVDSSISGGSEANVTAFEMDAHTGTHVDAPLHFIPEGATVDEIGLEPFVGQARVVDIPECSVIGAQELEAADIPHGVERLLLRTRNSTDDSYIDGPFRDDFAALSLSGAEWVVSRGLRLIGIDYLSIQRFDESFDVHRILLGAGIAILEGLDLRRAAPGDYALICLPLFLVGAEAAPARAILLQGDRL